MKSQPQNPVRFLVTCLVGLASLAPLSAQEPAPPPKVVLFTNVSIFDGKSAELKKGSVLIEDNMIKSVGADLKAPEGATTIDGGGRTLMPGMIDSHFHFAGYTPFNIQARQNVTEFMVGGLSMVRGESMLMRGFTTVRDTGGPSTYLRKLFDPGMAPGPRVYGSEAMITQTGGHGDFRGLTNVNPKLEGGPLHWYERHLAIFADGPTEVRR
ncbi:MAG: amidohydrolase family protein, partial [Verrucomicrobiales bacterium]